MCLCVMLQRRDFMKQFRARKALINVDFMQMIFELIDIRNFVISYRYIFSTDIYFN